MAGRSHTTRTPHRMNAALNRDVLGFLARQTVATQDLRKVIYVSPWGKGYHKVRNPVSGEEYIVADGLGGATMAPGSVAMAASFSGQHGETIISRPPAGFGGAAVSATTVTPNNVPSSATSAYSYTYLPAGFCWDPITETAIIARYKDIYIDEVLDESVVDFVKVGIDSIPHADLAFGTIFLQLSNRTINAMRMGAGSTFYVFHSDGAGTAPDTENQIISKYSYAGALLAEVNYDSNAAGGYQYPTAFFGGNLYAVESRAGAEPGGGPPFDSWARITKRDGGTLAISASWNLPNPSTYDGWTIRTSGCEAIAEVSGVLRAFIYHTKQPPGGADTKMVYQDFDSSLTPVGSYVQFSGNPTGGVGDPLYAGLVDSEVMDNGDLIFRRSGSPYSLHTGDIDGENEVEILASSLDSNGVGFGIQVIDGNRCLILGDGNVFATSIISSEGQELP